jgi:hypothetical protein
MKNTHAPYDSDTSADENWSEDVEYTQGGSHNDDTVSIQRTSHLEFLLIEQQLQVPSYPEAQEDTAPSLEEEDVIETNDDGEQAIQNFDLDYSTQHPTATSPDIDDFVDAHPIHQSATTLGVGHSADAPQSSASSSFLSGGQWTQMNNNYGPTHREAGTYSGENEGENSNGYYRGMDNRWHQSFPPQDLQTGRRSILPQADQYGTQHTSSAYSLSCTTSPLHSSRPLGVGEGSPLEYLHPANVQIPQQFQQPHPHTTSKQTTFGISQGPTASTYRTDSRLGHANSPSRPSRLASEVATSPNQQVTPTSQSDGGLYSNRPFTEEDFLPPIRKGGKLMEDRVTWNMEAKKNHYDCWARYHGRPALPKAVEGGLSDFKIRSKAIEALNEADQQSLQDFINAAKYFAVTGIPNRPSNHQAANGLGSGDEEESEMEPVNRPGTYRAIERKKRSREETREPEDAPENRRKRTKPMSTVRQGNPYPESQPSTKNPQGQMSFFDMEAANQWLANLGQPSILEAANTYLANRGLPSIFIESPRSMDLSYLGYPYVNISSQRDSFAPFPAGVNQHSAGVPGSAHRGNSRLSVPHKRRADTDSEDQVDAAQMTESHAKKSCTDNLGLTSMLDSNRAAPQRQQPQLKRRRGTQKQDSISKVHTKGQRQSYPVTERSSPRYAGAETASPNIYRRGASIDSRHRSILSGVANDVNDISEYGPFTPNQIQFPDLIPNQNLFPTSAPPSSHGRQSLLENNQTHQSANEGLAGEGHENYQAFDSNSLGVEHGNHGNLEFNPTSVEQDNLADFDFGSSSLRNTMAAPQHNENATGNNNPIPHINDDHAWLNECFDFENLPDDPSQQKHQ